MKTLSFIIAFSLLMTGCATKHVYSKDSFPGPVRPLTQEQVNELQDQRYQQNESTVLTQEDWKAEVGLTCPSGGREDVVIGKELGKNAFRVSGNTFARYMLARQMGIVTVLNGGHVSDITSSGRLFVKNMCPNGRIALVVIMPADACMFYGGPSPSSNYVNASFVATWLDRGKIMSEVSPSVSIYCSYGGYGSSQQREQQYNWKIQ